MLLAVGEGQQQALRAAGPGEDEPAIGRPGKGAVARSAPRVLAQDPHARDPAEVASVSEGPP